MCVLVPAPHPPTHTHGRTGCRAANFTLDELPEVMSYLHARGLKGFVAMNVLVFDDELAAVEQRVAAMARAGVDAAIVQVGTDGWGGWVVVVAVVAVVVQVQGGTSARGQRMYLCARAARHSAQEEALP